jgi:hypothetical protein
MCHLMLNYHPLGVIDEIIVDVKLGNLSTCRFADKWFDTIIESFPTIYADCTREEYLKRPVEKNPLVPKHPTLVSGCKILFKNGGPGTIWFPNAIDEYYSGVPDHKPLEQMAVEWEKQYEAESPPPPPLP